MRRFTQIFLATLYATLSLAVHAQSGFKGELDLQSNYASNAGNSLAAALGEGQHWDQHGWLRLMWSDTSASGWGLNIAYLGQLQQGGGVVLARRQHQLNPAWSIDPHRSALLRLSDVVSDHGQYLVSQRLDRLALSYSGAHLVLRIGRQALTWGGGLVFHPMDLFNPFSPNATYTAYKPGADMLYGQWLFDNGMDVQTVVVPRRNPDTGRLAADQSSAGIRWHGFMGQQQQMGIDVLLAQDYRAKVLGIAVNGALFGTTWTAEIVPTRLVDGGVRTSFLLNTQYAWSWDGRNVNGYIEYFHNGFGVSGIDHTLTSLPKSLVKRFVRGEVFTVSKNYLATGIDIQWTPLLTLKPTVISNLDDGSALLLGQVVYSLTQNTSVTAGLQWGFGGRLAEYGGGLETAPNSGIFVAPADRLYARFTWYFQ